MADEYTAVNPKTGERVSWDGKAWTPIAKVDPSPGPTKRLLTGIAGAPDDIDLSPENNKLTDLAHLGPWLDALKNTAKGFNPFDRPAANTAIERMKQPGVFNKIVGGTEYAMSGIPMVGQPAVTGMEKGIGGDAMGALGWGINAGLMGIGGAKMAPEIAKSPWAADPLRAGVAAMSGLGKTGEYGWKIDYDAQAAKLMAKHNEEVAGIKQKFQDDTAAAGKERPELRAAHELEVQQAQNRTMDALSKLREKKISASVAESEAGVKHKALASISGPVGQRLLGMADKVAEQSRALWKSKIASNKANWGAFDLSLVDPETKIAYQAEVGPVQQAILDARNNLIKGSDIKLPNEKAPGESIKIFDSIMRENAPKGGNLLDDPSAPKGISATATGGPIAVSDLRGYYTELGDRLYGGGDLPGDVAEAMKSVRKAIDGEVMRVANEHGQGNIYRGLKENYTQYAKDFLDKSGAFYKLLHAVEPKDRLDIIGGDTGRAVTDAMGRYAKEFNLNRAAKPGELTPIQLAESTRALQQQVRQLSRSVPDVPAAPPSWTTPGPEGEKAVTPDIYGRVGKKGVPSVEGPNVAGYAPNPAPPEIPEPNIAGFNAGKARLNEIIKRSKMFTTPSKFETSQQVAGSTPLRRATGWIYSKPGFQDWMGGYVTPQEEFRPYTPPPSQGRPPGGTPPPSSDPLGKGPLPMPPMNPAEKAALEREAGHPFLSDRQAYEYRMRKIASQAIADMMRRAQEMK